MFCLLASDSLWHTAFSCFHVLFHLLIQQFLFTAPFLTNRCSLKLGCLFCAYRTLTLKKGEIVTH